MRNFSSFILKYIINLFNLEVQQAKDIREENEKKFFKVIQMEMLQIKDEVDDAKKERYALLYYNMYRIKFEERIFETLTDTIDRIQNTVNDN